MTHPSAQPPFTRREALRRIGGGFGMVGLASLLGESQLRASSATAAGPLDSKRPHFAARAKHVIFLFMNGGVSQVDSFDPKPLLEKYDGQPLPGGNPKTERKTGNLMRSPFSFKKYGESGIGVSELFPHTGSVIDDVCLIRSAQTNIPNHEPSLLMMNCGHNQPGRPSMGAWLTYGLGTENQNLPGFVVLCSEMPSVVGPPMWNSAFLPGIYQGTYISTKENDGRRLIPFISNPHTSLTEQREELDLLGKLNRLQLERLAQSDPNLEASIQSMEVAFRMQTEAPQVFDISRESKATLDLYGPGEFARGCLMSRRLVESGVRVVQLYFSKGNPWDHHEDIEQHRRLALQVDRPVAALIRDLKSRGLLEETLIFFGTEFGRTPVVETGQFGEVKTRPRNGRDHNPFGFTVWMAGGGVKGGMTYGATDDFGFHAVQNPVHVHDLHATMLHLLGMDHEKLTYRYSGRDFRLTDVEGRVIQDIIS